jgi:hypothetical protein
MLRANTDYVLGMQRGLGGLRLATGRGSAVAGGQGTVHPDHGEIAVQMVARLLGQADASGVGRSGLTCWSSADFPGEVCAGG